MHFPGPRRARVEGERVSTPAKPPPGSLTRQCIDALRQTAYLIEHAQKADMLASLDWLTIRGYVAEQITWAAEQDGMMDGMMGGPEVLRALVVRGR